jgi:hypothetical protein
LRFLNASSTLTSWRYKLRNRAGSSSVKVGAQQIPALAPPGLAQLRTIEAIAEHGAVRGHIDCNQTPSRWGLLTCRGMELI